MAIRFKPPNLSMALRAIGRTENAPENLKKALDPGRDFGPITAPRPGDWLAERTEKGQTFGDFLRTGPDRPGRERDKIYLQPLGEFPEDRSPSLSALREYGATYFQMEVVLLPPRDVFGGKIQTRVNPFIDKVQVLSSDVLRMLKGVFPEDAYCLLGITLEDLYPDPFWNFVFGQVSLIHRMGVFSFARYDPVFYGERRRKGNEQLLLRRSCKVLAHETAHMFLLKHCIFFRCVMNGSNHLEESDARPLNLCPVCLRKLQHMVGFDVMERYEGLRAFYRKFGLSHEKKWIEKRLKRIGPFLHPMKKHQR